MISDEEAREVLALALEAAECPNFAKKVRDKQPTSTGSDAAIAAIQSAVHDSERRIVAWMRKEAGLAARDISRAYMSGWMVEVDPERHGDWLIWRDPLPIEWRGADWHFARISARDDIDIGNEESREMCLQTIDYIATAIQSHEHLIGGGGSE